MKYFIKPGIAAVVDVFCDDFPERFGRRMNSYVYLSEESGVTKGTGDVVAFEELPLKVRAAINRHFGIVFSLPVESREQYLKQLEPFEVEA